MFGLAQVDRLNGDVCLFMTDITHAMGDVRNTELQLYFVTSATGDGHGAARTYPEPYFMYGTTDRYIPSSEKAAARPRMDC